MNEPTSNGQIDDVAAWPPLGDEETFTEVLESMVADEAPRMFAVVQEWGTRADARIAAWGLVFENQRGLAMSLDGTAVFKIGTPESILPGFRDGPNITPRVVWFNPDARTPEWDPEYDPEDEA